MAASRPRPRRLPVIEDGTPVSGWNLDLRRQSSSKASQSKKNLKSSCNVRAAAENSAPQYMHMQSHGLVIGSQEKEVAKPNSKKNHKITKQNSQ